MRKLLKKYSNENPERFNKDFILLKDKDEVITHIRNIFEALEDVIPNLEFLECTLNRNESTFPEWTRKASDEQFVNIEQSRLQIINLKFKLTDPKGVEEDEIIEKYLYFPKLIDHTYFILNDNKFFPIYQIIDSATYNNNGNLTLKTLLMLLTLQSKNFEFTDIFGDTYSTTKGKVINLFNNKLNYFMYFFSEYGFDKSMKYFLGKDWNKKIILDDYDTLDQEKMGKKYVIFRLSSGKKESNTVLCIDKKSFNEDDNSLYMNIIDILVGKNEVQINDKNFWRLELGKVFSRNKNNYESKANDILISFKRILDNSTRNTLRLKDENKKDVFALVRWMVTNFEDLIQRDNMDLKYKRIRIDEYLNYELLLKISTATYRLLNKTEITMKDMRQIFSTLSPMFIVKKMGTNQLLRYNGIVNAIELFNPMLKFSFRGYQGLGEGSKNVNMQYRGLHPSYIGRLSLTASSANDPGMSGTFTPFLKNEEFYFTDDMLDTN